MAQPIFPLDPSSLQTYGVEKNKTPNARELADCLDIAPSGRRSKAVSDPFVSLGRIQGKNKSQLWFNQ
jgi:hypothetical protein